MQQQRQHTQQQPNTLLPLRAPPSVCLPLTSPCASVASTAARAPGVRQGGEGGAVEEEGEGEGEGEGGP